MDWLWELTVIFQKHQDLPVEISLDPYTYNPYFQQGLTPMEAYIQEGNRVLTDEELAEKQREEEEKKASKKKEVKQKRSLLKTLFG